MRKAQFAASLNRPPPQEDFKTKMKRELQQAARDAMSGKGTGVLDVYFLLCYQLHTMSELERFNFLF